MLLVFMVLLLISYPFQQVLSPNYLEKLLNIPTSHTTMKKVIIKAYGSKDQSIRDPPWCRKQEPLTEEVEPKDLEELQHIPASNTTML